MRVIAVILLLASLTVHARADDAYRFVTEYVRELGTIERLREKAEIENKKDQGDNSAVMSNCIRNSERFQLELREYQGQVSKFKLREEVQAVTGGLAQFYDYKIRIWREISDNCSSFLAPQEGVDYAKLAANAPKLTAQLEYLDKSIFQTAPLVFASLIDPRADKANHLSHLTITRAERDVLISSIDSYFGKKLDAKDQNYTVSTAWVLRGYLTKGYKCSDEAW